MNSKQRETVTLWVCDDCLFAEASGEEREGPKPDREPWGLVEDSAEVTAGLLYSEHADDCPNREAEEWVEECECEQVSFSWSACDGCGSQLGGSRHGYTLWLDEERGR